MSEGSSFRNRSRRSHHSRGDHWPDNTSDSTAEAVRRLVLEEDARATLREESPRAVSVEGDGRPQSNSGRAVSAWLRAGTAALLRLAGEFLRRPDAPRLIAIMLLVIAFLMEPWFLVTLFVFAMLTALVVYFSLGPDRVSELVVAWYERLRGRDPEKAETIRCRAAGLSKRASGIVERLPENWTTGLYLPDFEEADDLPEKMKSDPFDRLSAAGDGWRSR